MIGLSSRSWLRWCMISMRILEQTANTPVSRRWRTSSWMQRSVLFSSSSSAETVFPAEMASRLARENWSRIPLVPESRGQVSSLTAQTDWRETPPPGSSKTPRQSDLMHQTTSIHHELNVLSQFFVLLGDTPHWRRRALRKCVPNGKIKKMWRGTLVSKGHTQSQLAPCRSGSSSANTHSSFPCLQTCFHSDM